MSFVRWFFSLSLLLISQVVLALPYGSYLQTCQNCTQIFNKLTCVCRTRNGYPNFTTLTDFYRCSRITNEDGYLTCHHDTMGAILPGNYYQSCVNCLRDSYGNLVCQCPNDFGNYQASTLFQPDNCAANQGYIVNSHGHLTCIYNHYYYGFGHTGPRPFGSKR